MPHRLKLQLRFCDSDALGHINNASYAQYAEAGRIDFFEHSGTLVANLILARLELDFRIQMRHDANADILTSVEKFGNTSITLRQQVVIQDEQQGDQVACEIRSVIVFFDYETQRPTRVSDEVRDALQPYLQG